jgi:transposase-like protein
MAETRRLHRRQRDRCTVLSRLPRAAPQQVAQHQPAGALEQLNKEVKRRADVVGIFPNEAAIIRLIGAVLLEHNDEWQLQHRYRSKSWAELVAAAGAADPWQIPCAA